MIFAGDAVGAAAAAEEATEVEEEAKYSHEGDNDAAMTSKRVVLPHTDRPQDSPHNARRCPTWRDARSRPWPIRQGRNQNKKGENPIAFTSSPRFG